MLFSKTQSTKRYLLFVMVLNLLPVRNIWGFQKRKSYNFYSLYYLSLNVFSINEDNVWGKYGRESLERYIINLGNFKDNSPIFKLVYKKK